MEEITFEWARSAHLSGLRRAKQMAFVHLSLVFSPISKRKEVMDGGVEGAIETANRLSPILCASLSCTCTFMANDFTCFCLRSLMNGRHTSHAHKHAAN